MDRNQPLQFLPVRLRQIRRRKGLFTVKFENFTFHNNEIGIAKEKQVDLQLLVGNFLIIGVGTCDFGKFVSQEIRARWNATTRAVCR